MLQCTPALFLNMKSCFHCVRETGVVVHIFTTMKQFVYGYEMAINLFAKEGKQICPFPP